MIQIFLCGGTIDKTYDPVKEVFECKESHINEMIRQARISDLEIKTDKLFLKDCRFFQKYTLRLEPGSQNSYPSHLPDDLPLR